MAFYTDDVLKGKFILSSGNLQYEVDGVPVDAEVLYTGSTLTYPDTTSGDSGDSEG